MMSKLKAIILLVFVLVLGNLLFAISPTGTVLSIGQSSELGSYFPISSYISYDIYTFNFIEDYPTNLNFDIIGGYASRSISQNPITGLSTWCENYDETDPEHSDFFKSQYSSYGAIFTGWEMKFTQPLPLSAKIPGNITSWISTAGHYEQSVDSFTSYRTSSDTLFDLIDSTYSNNFFYGIPELNGNRYIHNFSLNIGSIYRNEIKNIPYSISLGANLAPQWLLNNFSKFGGHTNYFQISSNISASKSLFRKDYNDIVTNKKARLVELILAESLSYRYLNGTAIPQYVVSSDNLRHDISNTFVANLYGPQFITEDTYPILALAYSTDLNWGQLNNLAPQYTEYRNFKFTHSLNLSLDLRVIGIFHFTSDVSLNLLDFSLSHTPFTLYVKL